MADDGSTSPAAPAVHADDPPLQARSSCSTSSSTSTSSSRVSSRDAGPRYAGPRQPAQAQAGPPPGPPDAAPKSRVDTRPPRARGGSISRHARGPREPNDSAGSRDITAPQSPPTPKSVPKRKAASPPAGATWTTMTSQQRAAGKLTRIRKACDICRMRKVKCDGTSPCKPCQSLGADCTFQYVSRHRGPTSRFAAPSVWTSSTPSRADDDDGYADVGDAGGEANDIFAALYLPQPMTLPQVPPLPDALPDALPTPAAIYHTADASMAPPQSPSASASSASSAVPNLTYSTSFFDAVTTSARHSPAAHPVHISTPHVNIYPRMPRPQPQQLQQPLPPPPLLSPQPPQPPSAPPPSLQSPHAGLPPPLSTDAIAPLPVLELLVDDFFTYIHPLIPFPHEPTFRRSFERAGARQAPAFLALLASMIGCLAASFPRSVRAHLKARSVGVGVGGTGAGGPAPFARAICMVECCRDVALAARGAAFYTKPVLSVDDAATSYFLGLAAGYTFDWHLCRRFMAEAMSFVQELGFHRRRPPTTNEGGGLAAGMAAGMGPGMAAAAAAVLQPPPRRFNHVDDQIGKRIFWILYLAMRSLIQLGATLSETPLPPFNNARPFPDLPAEVDDAYIAPDAIHPQPAGTVSLITGFNKVIQIYATMDPIATMEYACGLHQVPVAAQRAMFVEALQAAKAVTDTLPDALYLPLPGGGHGHGDEERYHGPGELYDDLPGYRYYPPAEDDGGGNANRPAVRRDSNRSTHSYASYDGQQQQQQQRVQPQQHAAPSTRPDDLRLLLGSCPARRRQVQYDIQKTNIYASQLATRSYYVEMYLHLGEDKAQADLGVDNHHHHHHHHDNGSGLPAGAAPDPMRGERERIVHSLLFVLAAIPQCNMEPNGSALINKIRQVASTLLQGSSSSSSSSSSTSSSDSDGGGDTRAMEAQLMRFLEILMRLEKTGGPAGGGAMAAMGMGMGTSGMGTGMGGSTMSGSPLDAGGNNSVVVDDEEEELQSWASLREEQMRFAANGGFLGHYGV